MVHAGEPEPEIEGNIPDLDPVWDESKRLPAEPTVEEEGEEVPLPPIQAAWDASVPALLDPTDSEPAAVLPDIPDTLEPVNLGRALPLEIPWTTMVYVLEWKREVPAILNPTERTSYWIDPIGSDSESHLVRVTVDGVTFEITMDRRQGASERIVLGRDALSGRVLIRV